MSRNDDQLAIEFERVIYRQLLRSMCVFCNVRWKVSDGHTHTHTEKEPVCRLPTTFRMRVTFLRDRENGTRLTSRRPNLFSMASSSVISERTRITRRKVSTLHHI